MDNRTSLVFSLQTWLAETPEQKRDASTPGYLSVLMSGKYQRTIAATFYENTNSSSTIVMAVATVCPSSLS